MEIAYADAILLAELERALSFAPRTFKRDGRFVIGFGHVLRRGERYTELTVEAARHLLALDCNWAGRWIVKQRGSIEARVLNEFIKSALLQGCSGTDDLRALIGAPRKRAA